MMIRLAALFLTLFTIAAKADPLLIQHTPTQTFFLQVHWPDDDHSMCNATAIGPRHLLTAAHCVFDPAKGGPARAVEALAQYDPQHQTKSQHRYFTQALYINREYNSAQNGIANRAVDLAVIELAIFDGTPWLDAITPLFKTAPFSAQHIARGFQLRTYRDHTPHSLDCAITHQNQGAAIAPCPARPGDSGAGVILDNTVIAVQTAMIAAQGDQPHFTLFAPITPIILRDLDRILTGAPSTLFRKIPLQPRPYMGIDLRNRCNQPITLYLHLQTEAQIWRSLGPIDLPENSLLPNFARARSRIVYYHARSRDGRFLWNGPRQMQIDGQSLGLASKTFPQIWHDPVLSFRCPQE
jgi:V8-like Glu-specific endopeptidase